MACAACVCSCAMCTAHYCNPLRILLQLFFSFNIFQLEINFIRFHSLDAIVVVVVVAVVVVDDVAVAAVCPLCTFCRSFNCRMQLISMRESKREKSVYFVNTPQTIDDTIIIVRTIYLRIRWVSIIFENNFRIDGFFFDRKTKWTAQYRHNRVLFQWTFNTDQETPYLHINTPPSRVEAREPAFVGQDENGIQSINSMEWACLLEIVNVCAYALVVYCPSNDRKIVSFESNGCDAQMDLRIVS